MSEKKKKVVVFISSGIGNAVMIVPVLKMLKEMGNLITIVLKSPFLDIEFLKFNNFPFDTIVELTKTNSFKFYLNHYKYFDITYLDHSSASIANIVISKWISKNVVALRKNRLYIPRVKYIKPHLGFHSVVLNNSMVNKSVLESDFNLESLKLFPLNRIPKFFIDIKTKQTKVFSVQISSGNYKALYKNWPVKHWIRFFDLISDKYPEFIFVLLGDKNEISIGKELLKRSVNKNLINKIGKTNLVEASSILKNSDMYIGLDSGFMHLSVAYDIPTFSIFGASSEILFGYQKYDSTKHKVISKELSCRSCQAWIGNNTTKVNNPNNCPDFECLTELKPDLVFKDFVLFIEDKP